MTRTNRCHAVTTDSQIPLCVGVASMFQCRHKRRMKGRRRGLQRGRGAESESNGEVRCVAILFTTAAHSHGTGRGAVLNGRARVGNARSRSHPPKAKPKL